jgi:hypothetical protein
MNYFDDFPIEFKQINPEDFPQFEVSEKSIISPNSQGYIKDALNEKFNLKELTSLVKKKSLAIFVLQTNRDKIMEIFFGDELIYQRSENYTIRNGLLDF